MEIAKLVLEYLTILIWPLTVLFILILFKTQISRLFDRAKRLELPGGISLEVFEENIQEAKVLAKKVENEEKKKQLDSTSTIDISKIKETEANRRLVELGLKPSPSGLQISYYQDIAKSDPRLAMAGLRIDLELMLKNLAQGSSVSINDKESISKINNKLLENDAITYNQYNLINKLLQIANAAIHGIDIKITQANEVFEIMEILIDDFVAWLYWRFDN